MMPTFRVKSPSAFCRSSSVRTPQPVGLVPHLALDGWTSSAPAGACDVDAELGDRDLAGAVPAGATARTVTPSVSPQAMHGREDEHLDGDRRRNDQKRDREGRRTAHRVPREDRADPGRQGETHSRVPSTTARLDACHGQGVGSGCRAGKARRLTGSTRVHAARVMVVDAVAVMRSLAPRTPPCVLRDSRATDRTPGDQP